MPDAAFKALTAMVASQELLTAYGAMPADETKQQAWFDSIDANFPGIEPRLGRRQGDARLPRHPEPPVVRPDYSKVRSAMQAFGNNYRTTSGLDMDAELATLQQTLQGIFDAAQ